MSEHLETYTGPIVAQSGTLTAGSPIVTGLTTADLIGAVYCSGSGIPYGALVVAVDGPTQVTLSVAALNTGTSNLTFGLEPVSLAETKLHLRVHPDMLEDDSLIARLISAARGSAETLLRQTLIGTTYDLYLDGFPNCGGGYYNRDIRALGEGYPGWLPSASEAAIRLPKPPLSSVTSVKYYDGNGSQVTLPGTAYAVSTGNGSRVQPASGSAWPAGQARMDGVVIRYLSGAATAAQVPEHVKAAVLLMVGNWYEHREEIADTQTYAVSETVMRLLAASDPGIYP